MKINLDELLQSIDGKLLTDRKIAEVFDITGGYVSDMLSDVMGNASEGQVWITIMRHLNVIAVASLTGVSAVIFAKNIAPEKEVIEKANEENVCLISSALNTFELSGRLFNLLKKN